MNKRIIIGSVLVLTLLLLMPSIPATQVNVIMNEKLSEIPKNFDLNRIKEFRELVQIKHPILNKLVNTHLMFRFYRAGILLSIHLILNQKGIIAELANYRFQILAYNTIIYLLIWKIISDKLEWNWEFFFDG